ncbi:MAG: LPS assembly lipoprotein LptE [Rhodobacter sp.]|nr:LPS assembly lipoprotein LptE [Rhodobacter sp.]
MYPQGYARPNLPRRLVLILAFASLSACGFTPVYGPGGSAGTLRGSILAAEPDDRKSFVFVARLEERLGQPQSAPYLLNYTIRTTQQGLGITPDQATTRFNILGRVDYTLTDRATEAVLDTGSIENFAGFSATGSIVGTLSATDDANERLMVTLADQLVTRLTATAPDWLQ